MPKKHRTTPVASPATTPGAPPPAAAPAPEGATDISFNSAQAEAAFNQLRPTLEAIPGAELKPIRVDMEEGALVGLSFALRENAPAKKAYYLQVPAGLFDPRHLDQIQPAAWAAWYAHRQFVLANTSVSEAQLPASLVAEAKAVERRMQNCLEYHFSDHPEISKILGVLSPGSSHSDLASDLQGYGELYKSQHEIIKTDRKNYRATDLADANRISTRMMNLLAASLTPESRQWADLQQRAYTFLLNTYNEIADTGWWLHRREPTRDQDYQNFIAAVRAAFPGSPRAPAPAPAPAAPAPAKG